MKIAQLQGSWYFNKVNKGQLYLLNGSNYNKAAPNTPAESPNWFRTIGVFSVSEKIYWLMALIPSV